MKKLFFVLFVLFAICVSLFAAFFESGSKHNDYFTYSINSNPETLDPVKMSGLLEGYLAECVFEGLLQANPSGGELPEECKHLKPSSWLKGQPLVGVAKDFTVSEDMLTYTFKLRETSWILPNSEKFRPVTADDFIWSWKRVLDPVNASPYAQLIFVIENAENFYNKKYIELIVENKTDNSDIVKIALNELISDEFLGGKIEGAIIEAQATEDEKKKLEIRDAEIMALVEALKRGNIFGNGRIEKNYLVLENVPSKKKIAELTKPAITALDDKTLQIKLRYVTPYFLDLCSFHTFLPVCKENFDLEKHPKYVEQTKLKKAKLSQNDYADWLEYEQGNLKNRWWRPENLIYNGCYKLSEWAFSRLLIFQPSEHYWDKEHVMNKGIKIRIISNENTVVNLFYTGELDFVDTFPPSLLEKLSEKDENGKPKYPDFHSFEYLGTYYYKFNVKRKPFDDIWLRRAINTSIDRKTICREVLNDLCLPATGFVAKGIPNYPEFQGIPFDKDRMETYKSKMKYDLKAIQRPLTLLYNTSEGHKKRAIIIQEQLRNNIGLKIELRNMEWKSYLSATRKLEYDIARAGWIGDYVDPMTFMDMFITGGGNNNTGFSNNRYDRIILTYIPDIVNHLKKPELRSKVLDDIKEYEKRAFGPETWLVDEKDFNKWQEFFNKLKADILKWQTITDPNERLASSQDIRLELFQWAEHILCYDECVILPLYYYLHNVMYRADLKGIYENVRCHSPRRWIRIEGTNPRMK